MDRWMDGWMDRMDGIDLWMCGYNGWMGGWMVFAWIYGCMYILMYGWMHGVSLRLHSEEKVISEAYLN